MTGFPQRWWPVNAPGRRPSDSGSVVTFYPLVSPPLPRDRGGRPAAVGPGALRSGPRPARWTTAVLRLLLVTLLMNGSPWAGAASGPPAPGLARAGGVVAGAVALIEAPAPPSPAPRGSYTWPTGGPAPVLEGFDPPAVVWGRGHRGVDLALEAGSPVLAAAAGTVAFAGMVAGRPVVSIDHPDGIRTTYEPVEPVVIAGEQVHRGQIIGTLLAGHRADGVDALHWGARTGPKSYVNPLRLLSPAVIRLKPLES